MTERFHGLAGMYLAQPGDTYLTVFYEVEKVLYEGKSKYQHIMVVVLRGLGKALVLDGLIQSVEVDEHVYHEALVHPAMVSHPRPRRVLILGGGEGATLREVLKHNTVEEAVMVDIDGEVVEVSKRLLPEWHQGAFDDPRARVVIADGFEYVREARRRGESFDVVVMDLTDPFGSEIAWKLYSNEALETVRSVLSSEAGVLVVQAGNSFYYKKQYEYVVGSMEKVFGRIAEYGIWVPSFLYVNNYVLGMQGGVRDPSGMSAEEVDEVLRLRGVRTRVYNGRTHVAMFYHPVLKP